MEEETDPLDAYSRAVMSVAAAVLPCVASLRVRSRRGAGAGSARATSDGFLLTSAHVVAGAETATATFTDGSEVTRTSSGATYCRSGRAARPRSGPAADPAR